MLGRCNDREYRTKHRARTRSPDQAQGRAQEKSADIAARRLICLSAAVTNDAAGLRTEPFERLRPKHKQPEANKDGNRQGAKQVLIDSKHLSYGTENNRHARKGRHEA